MRLGHAQQSRPQYYDRNPVIKPFNYGAEATAPHGATVRWTYTVAAGKKAYIQSAMAHIIRDSVGAAGGRGVIKVRYSQDAGVTFFNIALAVTEANTQGEKDSMAFTGSGLCVAGDQLSVITADNSTGGSIYYDATAIAAEFDT